MCVYEVGPFHLHTERLALTHAGKTVLLGPKVVATLLALVERAGETIAKEAIIERVWSDRFVEEGSLSQNVCVIRRTFRAYGAHDPIQTVAHIGYRLRANARRVAQPATRETLRRPLSRSWPAAIVAAALALVTLALVHSFDRVPRSATLSPEGRRLYTIARYYWNMRTSDGVQKSMRYFARVIDGDPRSPLGYVGMADANAAMGDYCYGTHRPKDYFRRARAYVLTALSLDAESAPAHATLGFVLLHEASYAKASVELQRALTIDPSYAPAREWYGIALARQHRLDDARRQLEAASRIDPLSVATLAWLSRVAYNDGRLRDAATYRQERIDLAPLPHQSPRVRRHPTWAAIESGTQ
jgi:DNA-binding winged helix-turn-helix (wHTH) protein